MRAIHRSLREHRDEPLRDVEPDAERPAPVTPPGLHAAGNRALSGLVARAESADAGDLARLVALGVATPGVPLTSGVRKMMEDRLGEPLGDVRVHAGPAARESATALGARAFTWGADVVLAGDQAGSALSHELAHVVQSRRDPGALVDPRLAPTGGAAEREADRVGALVGLGLPGGPVEATSPGVARTPAGAAVETLASYGLTDWEVTAEDEADILSILRVDPNLSQTVLDLDAAHMLVTLIDRVDEPAHRRELMQLFAGPKLTPAARAALETRLEVLGEAAELPYRMARIGVTGPAAPFDPGPLTAALVSSDPSAPFTGVGATGVSPIDDDIPLMDQAKLAVGFGPTVARYSNAIPGSLPDYLATLSPAQRAQQAELLLRRKISTVAEESYAGDLPSRAQVIVGAAKAHNLHPPLIAAIILAEQRDQTKREDAKDLHGATSWLRANTSIGLGQVVVSTAAREDLFADTMAPYARGHLPHESIARLLASDDYNILASARYIRKVADKGSTIDIATLPNTRLEFPGIDMAAFARNSATWPEDNVRALGSEYTSRPWDDVLVPAWGDFVLEAYHDVLASGVF